MEQIKIKPIGKIRSPYKHPNEVPKRRDQDISIEAQIILEKEYVKGLTDLDGFSHAYILFSFHKATETHLLSNPPFDTKTHGVFATRSPHRPNHIGLSIIKIKEIKDNIIVFSGVDMIDGTPVIDIKPYINYLQSDEEAKFGWLEKHLEK